MHDGYGHECSAAFMMRKVMRKCLLMSEWVSFYALLFGRNGILSIGVRHQHICHDASATLHCCAALFCKRRDHKVLSVLTASPLSPHYHPRSYVLIKRSLDNLCTAITLVFLNTCPLISLSYHFRAHVNTFGHLEIFHSRVIFTTFGILCTSNIGSYRLFLISVYRACIAN